MKRLTLVMMCLLATARLSAQGLSSDDNAAIDKQVGVFLGLMEDKNYTQTLDLIYPKFFEHSSKKDMFQIFNLLEQSGIELKFNDLKVLDKTPLPKKSGIEYALIKYSLNMELPLNTDELKGYAAFLVPILKKNFGDDGVEYNKKEGYIKVSGEKFLVGVDDPEYNKWLFLIYDSSFMTAINKTLPPEVSKAAATRTK